MGDHSAAPRKSSGLGVELPPPDKSARDAQLADLVGAHGSYQLYLTIVLFARYVLLGLMANSGPLMSPDVTFYCRLPADEVAAILPQVANMSKREREIEVREEFKDICQLDLHLYHPNQQQQQQQQHKQKQHQVNDNSNRLAGDVEGDSTASFRVNKLLLLAANLSAADSERRTRACSEFDYEHIADQGRTMTSEFDLVCDRDYLRSLFQSIISAAIVVAYVFWGTFSDKYGRFRAQKFSLVVSLVAGGCSVVAVDFWTFAGARALCSFGDLGLVVSMTTTLVELVGHQYRGFSVALVNFGYALGVTLLPYVVAYFEHFRLVVAFTVLCHLLTCPLVFTTDESVRWLLTNGRYSSAKKELKRIVRWNRRFAFGVREGQRDEDAKNLKLAADADAVKFELLFSDLLRAFLESQLLGEIEDLGGRQVSVVETSPPAPAAADITGGGDNNGSSSSSSSSRATRSSSASSIPMIDAQDENESREEVDVDRRLNYGRATTEIPAPAAHLPLLMPLLSLPSHERQQRQTSPYPLDGCSLLAPESTTIAEFLRDQQQQQQHQRQVERREQLTALCRQPDCINIVATQLSFVGRVSKLFRDKQLMIVVFTIVWTTFNSELQYTSFIIINLEVGEDIYLNYVLGGCMEALAAVTASLLLSYAPRRLSLILFWLLISLFCFGLSVAHIDSTWAVWLLALAKFSQSALSSIASVAAFESFPTSLRQSGSGLIFTLGMFGSVFAPLIFAEFDDHVGMDRVLMTFSVSSLTAAALIYFYLRETRNCELR